MDQFEKIKAALDEELKNSDPNVGIAFGSELFNEFRKRGWFSMENFGVLGTGFLSDIVPAYQKTHFVFPSWNINDLEYKVGKNT